MNKKMNLNWSVDEITGNMPDISSMRSKEFQVKETSNTELLKDYLKRLGNGEDLESVKKDFVQNFSDVEASEIMKAEQELIKEGTPITEVQKLCDVHSALFHGLTKEEKIANAEKAVEESLKKEERSEMKIMPDAYVRKHELAKALRETKGHPLYSFTEEDNRKSGEKQFDYVDPKNREVQEEMESACTVYLKYLGAFLKKKPLKVKFKKKGFPCEASVKE